VKQIGQELSVFKILPMKLLLKDVSPYNKYEQIKFLFRDFDSVTKGKKVLDFKMKVVGAKENYNLIYKILIFGSLAAGLAILVFLYWSWLEIYMFNRLGIMSTFKDKIPKKFVS
jgi:hypothetical protein